MKIFTAMANYVQTYKMNRYLMHKIVHIFTHAPTCTHVGTSVITHMSMYVCAYINTPLANHEKKKAFNAFHITVV